ncbi:hypothetical protein F7P10_11215 [Actinomadura sp. WMMB 499]|nr:hypothetical protein F7P10_11215 [Actinomadura sp. WMMB 499]
MRRATAAHIEMLFPGVHCWWGRHTRRWWAFVPTCRGGRLVEADTPNVLFAQITRELSPERVRPPSQDPVRRTGEGGLRPS